MTIGVLLAAGRGGRMGQTKQLMPWRTPEGDKPLVAAAFDVIAGVSDSMVVVLGHDVDAVTEALSGRDYQRAKSSAVVPMFESIRLGLEQVQRIDPTADVILHLCDHPQVQRDTLASLIEAGRQHPGAAMIPTYRNKGGHPVLIPAGLIKSLLTAPGDGGLRQYWIDHPEHCRRLSVDDPGIVMDLDTPDDYERHQELSS